MKIAIASSGLGHVARGIETWALDTANALQREGVDVTLFAAGEVESDASLVVLPCIRRRTPLSNLIVNVMPPFTWRWGLKAGYGLEQLTFWRRLRRKLNEGQFDILHVQDPMIADLCRRDRSRGRVRAKEILAHGTEEPLDFLAHFDYLQHLAPWHLQQSIKQLRGEGRIIGSRIITPNMDTRGVNLGGLFRLRKSPPRFTPQQSTSPNNHCHFVANGALANCSSSCAAQNNSASPRPFWTAMPNFVDTELYCPVEDESDKKLLRRNLRIPEKAFVIGTAAAIKKHHKRIDYLIREFANYCHFVANGTLANGSSSCAAHNHSAFLVIAGSEQTDTEELQALAAELCPDRIKFLVDHPHERMPALLRCYDVFVLTSLFEMMPIALLEAIATGLPVITNNHPVLEWMGGPGGIRPDMKTDGALASALAALTPDQVQNLGLAARQHALRNFSVTAVTEQYVNYYKQILAEQS